MAQGIVHLAGQPVALLDDGQLFDPLGVRLQLKVCLL
jgi:hypothetical protein